MRRIDREQQDIGPRAGLDHAGLVGLAEEAPRVGGGGAQRARSRYAGGDEQLELGVQRFVGYEALRRLVRRGQFTLDIAHVCEEFPSMLALVAAGEGIALVPELALGDLRAAEPREITGLGARKLLAIQRTSRRETEPAVDAVVTVLRRVLHTAG